MAVLLSENQGVSQLPSCSALISDLTLGLDKDLIKQTQLWYVGSS